MNISSLPFLFVFEESKGKGVFSSIWLSDFVN